MTTRDRLPLRHHPVVWDLTIAVLTVLGIGGIAAGWWLPNAFVLLLFGISLTLLLYGSFVEPRRIVVNNKIARIAGLPPLKIAIAADFHVGPYKRRAFVARAVQRINALQPDLILLPGDFLFDSSSDVNDLAPLKDLHAPLGVFATLGNHDSGEHLHCGKHIQTGDRSRDVQRMLEECGITVLRNHSVRLTREGMAFALAGIDDLWMPSVDLPRALLQIPSCLPLILLSHNPDVVPDPASARASLIVSGHTHGGQVRIPGYGALHIPSDTGKIYDHGIFALSNDTTLALTHGIGETMCRARLFCPPEILLLHTTTS